MLFENDEKILICYLKHSAKIKNNETQDLEKLLINVTISLQSGKKILYYNCKSKFC